MIGGGRSMENKWVSVKERLPEDGECVLFYNRHYATGMAEVINGGFYDVTRETSGEMTGVTHWMNLPAAPKEDK